MITRINPGLRRAPVAATALLLGLLLLAGCGRHDNASIAADMNRGVGLMGQYNYDEAVKVFTDLVQRVPGRGEARLNLAIALFNRNRKEDLDAANRLLQEVLARDPGNLRALYFQAIVLQHIGQAGQAVALLAQVVKARPDDGAAWYLLALCKQRTGQPAEAEFRRAVELKPYLYGAYYQLYQIAMRAGEETRAQEYLARFKALRESPLGETIELPQYNQMGELALARPGPEAATAPLTRSRYSLRSGQTLIELPAPRANPPPPGAPMPGVAAIGDVNQDGRPDLVLPAPGPAGVTLWLQNATGGFTNAPAAFGGGAAQPALSVAIGDFDNDDRPDVLVGGAEGVRLFHGNGDGTFAEVSASAGLTPPSGDVRSVLFLDADHDGDLDLVAARATGLQLWNNNANGAFTNIAARAGLETGTAGSVLVLPGDLDGDRDADLVVLRAGQSARILLNELLGQYREATNTLPADLRGDAGGGLEDFDGDGIPDLLVLGGEPATLRLFPGDGRGGFKPGAPLGAGAAAASWGPLRGFRITDVDLDGDLDVVAFGAEVSLLLNDGRGHFVLQAPFWRPAAGLELVALELADLNGDRIPDLLVREQGAAERIEMLPGELTPPSTAIALLPSGIRSRDGRTRSPASGYGVALTVRTGDREQRRWMTGLSGGANQAWLPVVLGLNGARQADYVELTWPDGVVQAELALAPGPTLKVAELQRKISSCPVLFAWDGRRFGFVTDFAGVGGLGYLSAPGVYAPPQVCEYVKLEPDQLRARAGRYELRVTEPMEESAYIDRLELLAIDHPADQPVFPDERLALSGPAPTHELLRVDRPVFPVRATDPAGRDCTASLLRVDRLHAYAPPLDRRYVGFCQPHTLTLDFGEAVAAWTARDRVVLFLNASIEYPYSQTVYAASQSRLAWEPIRVEAEQPDGRWTTLVADAGAPGGTARIMTIDLGGRWTAGTRRLRLTTNLELFYDQAFLARPVAVADAHADVHSVPLRTAVLGRSGFAREVSPDGHEPTIYDYDQRDATLPFRTLRGAYTRFGAVEELLAEFDDRYVVMGPGDEIALSFDADALPPVAAGQARSFILVSHAYCKDMDRYTATPQTVEPLPFRGMSGYPYPATERYPDTPATRDFRARYNTRWLE